MNDFQREFEALLNDFTAKAAALARKHAIASLGAGLVEGPGTPASRMESSSAAKERARRQVRARAVIARKRPAQREAAGVALEARLVSLLREQPGQRVDQLGKALRMQTARLKPLIKRLVAQKVVRFEGNTRGRQYFPAGRAGTVRKARAKRTARGRPRRGRK